MNFTTLKRIRSCDHKCAVKKCTNQLVAGMKRAEWAHLLTRCARGS